MLITARVRLSIASRTRCRAGRRRQVAARGSDPGVVGYAIDHALLAAIADVLPSRRQARAGADVHAATTRRSASRASCWSGSRAATPWGMVQAEHQAPDRRPRGVSARRCAASRRRAG